MISKESVKKLIDYAEQVCESASSSPCGCDACLLFDESNIDEDGNCNCPMYEVISEIKEQMGEE